jgi:hypothetical protein
MALYLVKHRDSFTFTFTFTLDENEILYVIREFHNKEILSVHY